GNSCANEDHGRGGRPGGSGGAVAKGGEKDSPAVISGNGVQLPVDVTGNSVNVVGNGNASTGNESSNTPGDHRPVRPQHPPKPIPKPTPPLRPNPAPEPAPHTVPHARGALAYTGTGYTLQAVAASAALVAGGVVLRRRFRPGSDG
ncbi:chaplin, partial [Streptomyces sp. NPDC006265]|uniref:chaplin n=1 Tax=Streptomyces sp. NPDC006265 TaxID=3156740 RepID=UPI0033BB0802